MDRNHIPRRLKSANRKTNEAERTKETMKWDATLYVLQQKVLIHDGKKISHWKNMEVYFENSPIIHEYVH